MTRRIKVISGDPYAVELPYWTKRDDKIFVEINGVRYDVVYNEVEGKMAFLPF